MRKRVKCPKCKTISHFTGPGVVTINKPEMIEIKRPAECPNCGNKWQRMFRSMKINPEELEQIERGEWNDNNGRVPREVQQDK